MSEDSAEQHHSTHDMPAAAHEAIDAGERTRRRLAICHKCPFYHGRCAWYEGCCFVPWVAAAESTCPEGLW